MERLIEMLNVMSASILVVTAMYMQSAFGPLLGVTIRGAIGFFVLTYFVLALVKLTVAIERDTHIATGESAGGNIA